MKVLAAVLCLLFITEVTGVFAQAETLTPQTEIENKDRTFRLSRIPKLKVQPNSRVGHVTIEGLNVDTDVEITVKSLSGRRMLRKKIRTESGQVVLDLSKLFEGNYLIEITQNDQVTSTKIVIE
jgi:hypothetical protein